ncbi:MAG: DUF4087 domain-containing protein [Sphingosinicella sp.]
MFEMIAAMAMAGTPATQRRCGWLDNPTPANWWLTDRDGEWLISAQGGYQAPGMERIPDMSRRGWVRTNGYYGYGCACMTVTVDRAERRISRIHWVTPRSLRVCRADPRLPHR